MASAFCERAVAYLKAEGAVNEPEVSLAKADSPVLRNLKNGLVVAYLVDEGDSFTYVQYRHISDAGIAVEHLHEIGVSNLARLVEARMQVRVYGPVYTVLLDGNFEASLILIDDLWSSQLSSLVTGTFAVAIPARDILAFCDASSTDGMAELGEIVQRVRAGDHLLTPILYRKTDEGWRQHVA